MKVMNKNNNVEEEETDDISSDKSTEFEVILLVDMICYITI